MRWRRVKVMTESVGLYVRLKVFKKDAICDRIKEPLERRFSTMDFDKGVARKGTNCMKWDAPFVGEDVLPMWIADMDLPIAEPITRALTKVASQGAFGYHFLSDAYYDSFIRFMDEEHDYKVKREWITFVPNVVIAMFYAVQAITAIDEAVMITPPVYGPFFKVVRESGRTLIESPLHNEDGYYTMDFEDMESKITDKTKAFLLCNPHNPSGRVWSRDELETLVAFCKKHDLAIISDDIHSDILREGVKHTMIAKICSKQGVKCVSCTSPSKPFNLASIHLSNVTIEDEELREKYNHLIEINHIGSCSAFAEAALTSAYNDSRQWLSDMNAYVEGNIDYFIDQIHKNFPYLTVVKPEGTYLVWVDFSKMHIRDNNIKGFLKDICKIFVNEGEFFGAEGAGHVRFNMACPRKNVEMAIERMIKNIEV